MIRFGPPTLAVNERRQLRMAGGRFDADVKCSRMSEVSALAMYGFGKVRVCAVGNGVSCAFPTRSWSVLRVRSDGRPNVGCVLRVQCREAISIEIREMRRCEPPR